MLHRLRPRFPALIAGLLLASACQPPEKPTAASEQLQHFASGEVSRRYSLVEGKKQGAMIDYYIDGKIRAERNFIDDQQEGATVFYYPGGQVKETQYFEKGLRQGGDTTWYEDGRPQFVLQFNQGKKDGYVRKWAPDGSLTFEAKYAMDSLVEVKGERLGKRDSPKQAGLAHGQ